MAEQPTTANAAAGGDEPDDRGARHADAGGRAAIPLLEREGELEALAVARAAARGGAGRIVLVEGPAGVGKTRLLGAGAEAAAADGFEVLCARATELERDFPFGVVRQLLEPRLATAEPGERATLLAGAAALAKPVLGGSSRPEGPEGLVGDPDYGSLHGLYWLVANLSDEAPLLVAVDDAHWADPASLRFLRYLAPRLDGLPVLLCVALRPAEPGAGLGLGTEVREHPDLLALGPRPFSCEAAAAIVREWLGPGVDERLCRSCHETSGGNPFLLFALLRELAEEATDSCSLDPSRVEAIGPKTVGSAVCARLRRAGEGAQALAEAVAVLGDRATLEHATALAELDDDTAAARADTLASVGVLEPEHPLRFAHPIVRKAVYEGLPGWRRTTAHRRAAGTLAAADEPADAVAAQLLATEGAGEDWAVEVLREAASGALRRGAPEEAARYLRRALREPPPAEERASVLIELGTAEARAAEPAAIDRLAEATRIDPEAALERGGVLELSRSLLYSERATEAIRIVEPILSRLAERDRDTSCRLEAEMLAAGTATPSAYELVKPRYERARRGAREARTSPEKLVLGVAAWERAITGGTAAEVTELARCCLADGRLLAEETPDSPAMLHAVNVLTISDELAEARRYFDTVIEDARRRGSARALGIGSWWRAWAAYREGRLAEAELDARQVLEVATPDAWRLGGPMAVALVIDSLIERDRLEEATVELERSGLGDQLTESILYEPFLLARARLRMLTGEGEAAFADVLACGRRLERWGVVNPGLVPWRGAAARGMAAIGDMERALELADQEVREARAFGAPRALGMALRSRALLRRGEAEIELLEEAREVLEGSEALLELARVLRDIGAAVRRAGRPSEAREPLRRALELAAHCEATALERRTVEELVAAGARPRRQPASDGAEALTPAERRVAERAAAGMSNREIAQELFVTVRTVETHLGHAYRTLDISSRVQLADKLGTGEGFGRRPPAS